MIKVIAVVVTHNRLSLLKECIQGIRQQLPAVAGIIVINNGSSDGTKEWLDLQNLTVIHQENKGSSAGFHTGIEQAYKAGADWIWIMDDDTIPLEGSLESLLKVATSPVPAIGFLASKVIWTDGSPHAMNIQDLKRFTNGKPFNYYDEYGMMLITSSSFVSLFVSREAVNKVGLPIKEFFIWGDDEEYTRRIVRSGMLGGYVPASRVLHKTPNNHSADIYRDGVGHIWKYRYGLRNELWIMRNVKGNLKFWTQFLKRIFLYPLLILFKRKDHRWIYIKTVWSATFNAISFNPRIDKVS